MSMMRTPDKAWSMVVLLLDAHASQKTAGDHPFAAGLSHMTKYSVIPSGAARRAAQSRDLF
jgi:hypothetical protein